MCFWKKYKPLCLLVPDLFPGWLMFLPGHQDKGSDQCCSLKTRNPAACRLPSEGRRLEYVLRMRTSGPNHALGTLHHFSELPLLNLRKKKVVLDQVALISFLALTFWHSIFRKVF